MRAVKGYLRYSKLCSLQTVDIYAYDMIYIYLLQNKLRTGPE